MSTILRSGRIVPRRSPFPVGLVLLACFVGAVPLGAAVPVLRWWWRVPADVDWTNRPLETVKAEAAKGDATAQYYLGRACYLGQGQDRDLAQAVAWVRRAADQGHAQAQFALARFHWDGIAVPPNPAEAVRWLARAADQGHANALGLLGRANEYGEGTARNAPQALEYYQRAIAAGSREAQLWLGEFYLRGEARTARRTNFTAALSWFERAASNRLAVAALHAATMYGRGQGAPPDLQRALAFTRLAADLGNVDGLDRLADYYAGGLAEPRGPEEAPIRLLRKAAILRTLESRANGVTALSPPLSSAMVGSCEKLWNRYRFGVGTPRDYVATAQWMWLAGEENKRRAQAQSQSPTPPAPGQTPLTRILNNDPPPSSDEERRWQQAARLVTEALELNQPEASRRIAEDYRDGSPLTPVDTTAARAWFERAAQLGSASAATALKALEQTFSPDELAQAKHFWVPPPR